MPPNESSINKYYFPVTNSLHDGIVNLGDFILPTATSLWQFRQTIKDEFNNDLLVEASYLAAKYNKAPGTRVSTNLIVPFREHTWEMQRERLAEIALVNTIALYEVWCDDICEIFGRPDLAIKLQYPTNPTVTNGARFAIETLKAVSTSVVVENSVQKVLRGSKKILHLYIG